MSHLGEQFSLNFTDWLAHVFIQIESPQAGDGHNKKLMESCQSLNEYSQFIEISRRLAKERKNLKDAMKEAIEYCIENDILANFLRKYRGEVLGMILEEFDVKKYERTLHEEADNLRLAKSVEAVMQNLQVDVEAACKILNATTDEYYRAKNQK